MHEDELTTNVLEEEEEALLPDGWQEGDDIFAEDDNWGRASTADEQEGAAVEAESTQNDSTNDAETPTTSEAEENGQSAEGENVDSQPDQAEVPAAPPSRILKLRVNHTDHEIDVGKLSDEALIERLQKAAAFDAMRENQQKQKYRQVYQDQIFAGMTEAAARMVAANECGGKSYPLEDEAETPAVAPAPTPTTVGEPKNFVPARDLNAEVHQLKALYPDFQEMPNAVAKEVAAGKPLLNAYIAYREKQAQQAADSLKKENAILKQNAASAAKAPVKGVTGSGATGVKADDDFLRGFNEDY